MSIEMTWTAAVRACVIKMLSNFAGLFLLMGSGIHIVWGVFRVFDLYRCREENSFYLRLVIWSWYIGAIIGSCVGGRAVATMRKGHLYVSLELIP